MEKHIYTAGLIDGEGTVTLTKSGKFRYVSVTVTSTSFELLEYLKNNYKGIIVNQKTYSETHKKSWSWKVVKDDAINFILLVSPYMKELKKVNRCKHILNNYKKVTVRNGKYTKEQSAAKLLFEEQFFHLD